MGRLWRGRRERRPGIWYKLDLSAIVYPTLERRDYSSVYRLSIHLWQDIDPALLQQALDKTLPRFPTYKSALRRGLFWRYLEPNHRPGPFVEPDVKNPCQPMPLGGRGRYLLRVYYYGSTISLEAHHCLGDGSGGMALLQTLAAAYLGLLGHSIRPGGFVKSLEEQPQEEEWEDAYMRYASASVCPPRPQQRTYRLRGTKESFYTLNILQGSMSLAQVKAKAGEWGVTVTEYLNAVLLYALAEVQRAEGGRRILPLRIAMPVNLRRFFPSRTLRNFITMVYPGIDPRLGEYDFGQICRHVRNDMRYHINAHMLRGDITTNAAVQRHPLIRIVPLFVKDVVVRSFYAAVQDGNSTVGLTNMGAISVPEDMEPLVRGFDIYMGQPFSSRTNCAIVSYKDTLTINFASSIVEADVERHFFRFLVGQGLHVHIESNRKQGDESV